jgi:hypothetical protein
MVRTGIPVSVLEAEGDQVINTMVDVLNAEAEPERGEFIDTDDPETIPEEWR